MAPARMTSLKDDLSMVGPHKDDLSMSAPARMTGFDKSLDRVEHHLDAG